MSDANKIAKLNEIGYRVQACCRICKHAAFAPYGDFGSCGVHSYNHAKHTANPRKLSVHQGGVCSKFTINAKKEEGLRRSGFLPMLGDGA